VFLPFLERPPLQLQSLAEHQQAHTSSHHSFTDILESSRYTYPYLFPVLSLQCGIMPYYHATGTKVELCSASLASTTTIKPERGKGSFTSNETVRAEMILKKGKLLTETHIPCCGEDTRLHYLGLNKEVPFFMVHAGAELYRSTGTPTAAEQVQALLERIHEEQAGLLATQQPSDHSEATVSSASPLGSMEVPGEDHDRPENDIPQFSVQSELESRTQSDVPTASATKKSTITKIDNKEKDKLTSSDEAQSSSFQRALPPPELIVSTQSLAKRESTASEPELIPQALGVLVTLTSNTFLRSFDDKKARQDVKIDVFFNGEFADCVNVPARWSNDRSKAGQGNMIQLISGKRIQRLVERPWVIVPPSQNEDGSLRTVKHTKGANAGPRQRWEQIGAALLKEAEAQGFNSYGDCTPSGGYLASLSKMEMPDAVEDLQSSRRSKFGVIDVVISAGRGKKGGPDTFYLTEPTRMVDERFKHVVGGFNKVEAGESSSSAATIPISSEALQPAQPMAGVSKAAAALNSSVARRIGNVDMIVPLLDDEQISNGLQFGSEDARYFDMEVADNSMDEEEGVKGVVETDVSGLMLEKANGELDQDITGAVTRGCELSAAPHLLSFPSLDFANIIDTSPAFDENQRCDRSIPVQSDASSLNISSPEDGRHRRGYMTIHRSEFTCPANGIPGGAMQSSIPRSIMAPPQTPSLAFGAVPRLRKSDVINSSGLEYPNKRQRSISKGCDISPQTTGSKTVSGYLGMSRRGVISRRLHSSPLSQEGKMNSSQSGRNSELSPPASRSHGTTSHSFRETFPVVRRIVIIAKDTIVVDKTLDKPFLLSPTPGFEAKISGHSSSPVYPLDEAVVFSLVDVRKDNTPSLFLKSSRPGQTVTPQPSSSPIRQIQLNRLENQTPSMYTSNIANRAASSSFQSGEVVILAPVRKSPVESPGKFAVNAVHSSAHTSRTAKATSSVSTSAPKPLNARKPSKPEPPTKNPQAFGEELREAWKTPELSKDCVISYAEEVPQLTGGEDCGVVRHIRSARPGWFQESEVVLAVRYLIG
jgi:hypothetical protein